MLPTTRHIKELIEHSENHYSKGGNSDLKFALIHADNSVEILLKEHLRYVKNKAWGEIEKKGFHSLLGACGDIELVKNSRAYFQAYHDIRNSVYHTGTLVPPKEDVKAAIGLAKTLFNKLHPDVQFKEAEVAVPSKEIMGLIIDHKLPQPYLNYFSLVQDFSKYLERNGYSVTLESVINNQTRADILAEKADKTVICELKSSKNRPVGLRAARQLHSMVVELDSTLSEKNVEGWLITDGGFTQSVRQFSLMNKIRLIDGNQLKRMFDSTP